MSRPTAAGLPGEAVGRVELGDLPPGGRRPRLPDQRPAPHRTDTDSDAVERAWTTWAGEYGVDLRALV